VSTRQQLQNLGINPRRSLGQNFLVDPHIAHMIANAAFIDPGDVVIEIGPGVGMLTRQLLARAACVIAVELDASLLPVLQAELGSSPHLKLIHGDALEVDYAALVREVQADSSVESPVRFVSNLPYYITSAVIRRILELELDTRAVVLTVQLEVAERIIAQPGDMSLMSVSVQFYGQPEIVKRLSPSAFYPQPDVDSAVLRITPYAGPPPVNPPALFAVARAGFSQKRKQLRNTLAAGLNITKQTADELLMACYIDPSRRAETLTMPEWIELARCYDITISPKHD
jgi:16S rRNA (adenine1518-N6/adenine1519-N6)-dimethyltransferase